MTKNDKQRLTKEGVSDWFTQKQERNRQRRENRVTGEDVRHRLAELRDSRGERPGRLLQVASICVGVALLGCAAFAATNAITTVNANDAEMRAIGVLIEQAQGELASIPTGDESGTEVFSGAVQEELDAATAAGRQLAELQQEYATILYQGNGTGRDDRVSEQALQAALQQQDKIASLIREDSIPTEDAVLDGDQLDPRLPWFIGYEADGLSVVDPGTSSWELIEIMPSDIGSYGLTWANKTAEGQLLAWATASYFVEDAKFGQFTVGKTSHGTSDVVQVQTGRK